MNLILKKSLRISAIVILSTVIFISVGGTIYYQYWRNSNTINTFSVFYEPQLIDYNSIYWRSDSLGTAKVEKTAFFLKVKIEEIPGNFYMQFDTGTPKTIFYGNTLSKVLKTNSGKEILSGKDSIQTMANVKINIGKTTFFAKDIIVKPNFGSSELDTAFTVIGTIGFDALLDKTLILNFKTDKLAFTKKSISDLNFETTIVQDASVGRFPLLIPAKIGNNKIRFFFDTGSSMFPILTSIGKLKKINGVSKIDTLCCVRNWSNMIPVYRRKINSKIDFNGIISENDYVYGIDMSMINILNFVPESFLYAMTGNKLFDNRIIVIDSKNNKFGISK